MAQSGRRSEAGENWEGRGGVYILLETGHDETSGQMGCVTLILTGALECLVVLDTAM